MADRAKHVALPARPSIEFLRKLAKEKLKDLRRRRPSAKLAAAQLQVARGHGFASWRALKTHVELIGEHGGELPDVAMPRRAGERFKALCDAIRTSDVPTVAAMLNRAPR